MEPLFILFAENSQILLKISVIPILLTNFHLSGSAYSVSKQPTQLIIAAHNCRISLLTIFYSIRLNKLPCGRHYGYLDPTLASKAKERKKQASAAAERRYLKEAEPQLEQEQDLDVPRAVSK